MRGPAIALTVKPMAGDLHVRVTRDVSRFVVAYRDFGRVLRSVDRPLLTRNLCVTLLVICVALLSSSLAQMPVPTSRVDNSRTNATTDETLLIPTNVNVNSFGHLFSTSLDDVAMAQPLYVPNVGIPGQGDRDVIFVVTQADSAYAIDADTGVTIWNKSMLFGGTTAQGDYLPCGSGHGYTQEGIVGTPAIDTATGTLYLVAKTVLNATVRHHLHALDIVTGNERAGSPVLITAQSTSNKGHVTVFDSLHQKNRPGILLLNGILYLGFGSNGCNDGNSGWVLSYDKTSLTQLAVYNTSPDYGLASIWQAGTGLAADQAAIYLETAEAGAHGFDVPNGGQTYCNSVLMLSPGLTVADYFTPWTVAYLNAHDLDLSSNGVVILPDQAGPHPHELVASGKQGYVYVLDRDNLGMYTTNDSQVLQEFALIPDANRVVQFGSPAYWNNIVYFAPNGAPLMAFPLTGGLLGTPVETATDYPGSHSPSISANGNTNGVLWAINGQLRAFDAVSLRLLYSTDQAPNGRDTLPSVGHFVTQTVANGRVYVATENSLEIYGLLQILTMSGTAVDITAGATTGNTSTITVTPVNEFSGEVSLSCALSSSPTGAQHLPTCSVPSSVNIEGSNAVTVTMTIASTPFISGALDSSLPVGGRWLVVNGAVLVGMFLFRSQARGRSRPLLTVVLGFVLLGSFVGCGGGASRSNGNSGTTPGSYSFLVAGRSHGYSSSTTIPVTIR